MRYLLDTHALIWFLTDDPQLPSKVKASIESRQSSCWVSIASYWEIGIKYSLGKIKLGTQLETVFRLIGESGFAGLPITPGHILQQTQLPFHHRDPFDRLIIAQAIDEQLTILTRDAQFKNYPSHCWWGE